MKPVNFSFDVKKDDEVVGHIFGRYYPARPAHTSGLPEHCYPYEPPSFCVLSTAGTVELTPELEDEILAAGKRAYANSNDQD